MKRKYVWLAFCVVVSAYFCLSAYLFSSLTSDLFGKSGVEDIEQKRDYLWEFVKPVQECSCFNFGYESLIPEVGHQPSYKQYYGGNSSCKFSPSSHDANIEMSRVLSEMRMDYPSYVWTPSGWIQQMDTTYDESQWNENPLQVHVVPFSHNDPGWTSTYESYYSSWSKTIIDTIVEQLTKDHDMTFVWAEVLFLQRWYQETSAQSQAAFKKLLGSGRFEIVSGGWVMSDEAITHYGAFIDQLMEGQLWLKKEFGYKVKVAWSIDPFGHSSTASHLLHLSGIDAMYIHRAHYAVKKHLAFKKQLEFMWQQDWDRKTDSSIFCHLSPYLFYGIQYSCGPDINVCCKFDFSHKKCWKWGSYQSAQSVTSDNVRTRAYELLDQLRKKAQFFRHNHVIFPFGDDFRFKSSSEWQTQFNNLKKVFFYMNSHPEMKVQVQFSTVGRYLEAVRSNTSAEYPTLQGDFFPYSDRSDQYWSGYFSSRPLVKSLARIFQAHLRSAEILFSYAAGFQQGQNGQRSQMLTLKSTYKEIEALRRSLGLLQHHDTITGTSGISVVSDTLKSIKSSLEKCRNVVSLLVGMMPQFQNERIRPIVMEEQLSQNSVPRTKLIEFDSAGESIVVLFNPLANSVTQIVHLSVPSPDIKVFDMNMNSIECQVTPILDQRTIFVEGQFEVYFEVKVAGLGMVSYRIKKLSPDDKSRCHRSMLSMINIHMDHRFSSLFNISWHETLYLSISNRHLMVTFCKCTYLMQSIISRRDMIPYKAEMKFGFYRTGHWINPFVDKSGAYIFLPDGPAKDMGCRNCRLVLIKGPLFSSATTWLNITSQTVALYNTNAAQGLGVHVTNHVDLHSHDNVEVILKLKTSVENSDYFFTDLNSFQMHRRKTLNRLPIQGNFYPMTSAAFIEDNRIRFSLLSAESHGIASLNPGTLELILDRRLAQDDWRGLKEGVQDNVLAVSQFIVVVEEWKNTVKSPKVPPLTSFPSRIVQQMSNAMENRLVFLSSSSSVPTPPFSLLSHSALPCDVHLVNMRSLLVEGDGGGGGLELLLVLHRVGVTCEIENLVASDCTDSDEIMFSSLFRNFTVTSVDEMTLTGTSVIRHILPDTPVVLNNMEIKTWKLNLI